LETLAEKEDRILETHEKFFAEALRRPEFRPRVLEGVNVLLDALSRRDLSLAVYSGESVKNLKRVLEYTKLLRFFKDPVIIGASREDPVHDRGQLLTETIEAAREYDSFTDGQIYVFDDFSKAIQAGNELGLITVGVGTGPEDNDTVKRSEPSVFFEDFSSPYRVIETLGI